MTASPRLSILDEQGLELTPDGQHVRWSRANQRHPRNWSKARKAYDTGLIIWVDVYTTAVNSAGGAAASEARHEYGISTTMSVFVFVTLYLLGQGVGGVIFPPYSEAFGRKKLYIVSTGLYSIFCVMIAVVPSLAGVAIGRFMTGVLSGIPTTITSGSIEDLFNAKDRIWCIFLWAMISNLGLALGPIMSAYIIAALGWRWVFYIAAIVLAVTTCSLFALRESRPSLILSREVAMIRESTGLDDLQALNPDFTPDLSTFARMALFRPARLFFTEPIIFMVAVISAVAAAIVYLFTVALPTVYEQFGFSEESASLPFLAIGLGLILSVFTRLIDDRIVARLQQQGRPLKPEDKLLGFSTGAPALACGLWWFAWTIPPHVPNLPWIVPTLALIFVGYALNEFDTVLIGYVADSYLSYSASGFAAVALLRSILSATFPLFAPRMFERLSANVAMSILAALGTGFCIVPKLFTRYGERIRAKSKFAAHSLQVYEENGVDENGY
ncbi:hypothetical protein JX265_007478 [Neoarthrinium moseri]|uniref:Major facilitator superfamily (MFS) profile domain-containing protein n=1 Tax=Neoarthrinium moseri TaxID=1658444 RepID=A0A9P9WJI3_9PEZI|nr:hypothetical protein JX266_000772 [Neoarthrinium moseri]KAI1866902.1 hypothetical protein JX265_007478 [Neoarthrinium moseri]